MKAGCKCTIPDFIKYNTKTNFREIKKHYKSQMLSICTGKRSTSRGDSEMNICLYFILADSGNRLPTTKNALPYALM